jgi:RNA recognition motif-containing protein
MGFWDAIRRFFSGDGDMQGGGEGGNRIYVGNLSYKVKEEELRSLFSKYGRIKALHLIRDKMTRRLKGYAFVELDAADNSKALELNGKDFLGRKLVVSLAKAKTPRSAAPSKRPRSGGNSSGGPNNRWNKKRRSGPRVYGAPDVASGDATIKRYE